MYNMTLSALRANATAFVERLLPLITERRLVPPAASMPWRSPPFMSFCAFNGDFACFHHVILARLVRGATRAMNWYIVPLQLWIRSTCPMPITMGIICAIMVFLVPGAYSRGQRMMREYPHDIEICSMCGPVISVLAQIAGAIYLLSLCIQGTIESQDALLCFLVILMILRALSVYEAEHFAQITIDLLKAHYAPDGLAWTHERYRRDSMGREYWIGYKFGEEPDPRESERIQSEWVSLSAIMSDLEC